MFSSAVMPACPSYIIDTFCPFIFCAFSWLLAKFLGGAASANTHNRARVKYDTTEEDNKEKSQTSVLTLWKRSQNAGDLAS